MNVLFLDCISHRILLHNKLSVVNHFLFPITHVPLNKGCVMKTCRRREGEEGT